MAVHIAATHKNEDYTPRYLMTEQLDSDEPALHMFETVSAFRRPARTTIAFEGTY